MKFSWKTQKMRGKMFYFRCGKSRLLFSTNMEMVIRKHHCSWSCSMLSSSVQISRTWHLEIRFPLCQYSAWWSFFPLVDWSVHIGISILNILTLRKIRKFQNLFINLKNDRIDDLFAHFKFTFIHQYFDVYQTFHHLPHIVDYYRK